MGEPTCSRQPRFGEALRFWLKLGFISFGGPGGQIAIMHAELVERRRWISHARFMHALNFCMLLPGPEAQQLATYSGWLLHRTWGGIAAGTLFFLPAALLLWGLSYVYAAYGQVGLVTAVFDGLKPAVTAIVAAAVLRIGRKALRNEMLWTLAAAAFVAIFFLAVPFPVIVISAAVLGWMGGMFWPRKFAIKEEDREEEANSGNKEEQGAAAADGVGEETRPTWRRAGTILAVGLTLWWAPIGFMAWWNGPQGVLTQEGLFFSKAAMVTFGGAYAVLPYVAQRAVETHGWLEPGQMLDGLGLAETTPGPLIMVVQFVGFMGGWQNPGELSPLLAATLGALLTTWVTFVPCFIWIFLGAPHMEALRGHTGWTAALTAVTAAVVGVILNLAVWFGLHVLFPESRTINLFGWVVALTAFVGMVRLRWGIVPVIVGAGIAGWLRSAVL